MKKTSKKFNIVMTVIVLSMLFACAFSATFSYFTATTNATGNITFYDLQVDCLSTGYKVLDSEPSGWSTNYTSYYNYDNINDCYTSVTGVSAPSFLAQDRYEETSCVVTSGSIMLSLSSSLSSRGAKSKFRQGNINDVMVGLKLHNSNSCACFVRIRIDAYIGEITNESVNYGADFTLQWFDEDLHTYGNSSILSQNSSDKKYYYLLGESSASDPSLEGISPVYLFNAVKLNDDANLALVGAEITIRFSYEAIQAENGAVTSEWSANKYVSWS